MRTPGLSFCSRHMGDQIERAVSVLRHLRFVDVSELVGLPRLGDAQRLEYLLGRDVVRVARLILGAVRRGPPRALLASLCDQQTPRREPGGQTEQCRATPVLRAVNMAPPVESQIEAGYRRKSGHMSVRPLLRGIERCGPSALDTISMTPAASWISMPTGFATTERLRRRGSLQPRYCHVPTQ